MSGTASHPRRTPVCIQSASSFGGQAQRSRRLPTSSAVKPPARPRGPSRRVSVSTERVIETGRETPFEVLEFRTQGLP